MIGDMRDRLRFERRVSAGDDYGNTVSTWEPQFIRPAILRLRFGGEHVTAARAQGQNPVNITVGADSGTRQITAEWRAVNVRSGEVFAILSVVDPTRRNRFVEIEAVSGVAA